jgi:hypothetical protein
MLHNWTLFRDRMGGVAFRQRLQRTRTIVCFAALLGAAVWMGLMVPAASAGSWKQTCPQQRFCFEHPSAMMPVAGQGADSLAGRLAGDGLTLGYDLGGNASTYEGYDGATYKKITVSGRDATLISIGELLAVNFARVASGEGLTVSIRRQPGQSPDVSMRILKSIVVREP